MLYCSCYGEGTFQFFGALKSRLNIFGDRFANKVFFDAAFFCKGGVYGTKL